MNPQIILDSLKLATVPDPTTRFQSKLEASLIGNINRTFDTCEEQLEVALSLGTLEKNKPHLFLVMESAILNLLKLGYNADAYSYAIRYASIIQEYTVH